MDGQEQNTDAFEKAELLLKYLRKTLSAEETGKLSAWLAEDPRNREFLESLQAASTMDECLRFFASTGTDAALENVQNRIRVRGLATGPTADPRTPSKVISKNASKTTREAAPEREFSGRSTRWRAAAALVLLAAAAILWWPKSRQKAPADTQGMQQPADKAPGSDKATLSLADGSVIMLDEQGLGTIREQNGIRIRQEGAEVIYEAAPGAGAGRQPAWNTIATPRGGQYRIALPDGSSVWLNADSELRFPASFTGGSREVRLRGEAYFEVARRTRQPFRVKVDGLTIEVLGTHFNVNAYDDNSLIRTTLIEGKVKVSTAAAEEYLFPGKQASMDREKGSFQVKQAAIENVLAWKNGLFRFSGESVEEVMKKLGRWYDVEVVYGKTQPETRFSGMISRNVPLSQVLKMLETTGGAGFRMEGNKIIVTGGRM